MSSFFSSVCQAGTEERLKACKRKSAGHFLLAGAARCLSFVTRSLQVQYFGGFTVKSQITCYALIKISKRETTKTQQQLRWGSMDLASKKRTDCGHWQKMNGFCESGVWANKQDQPGQIEGFAYLYHLYSPSNYSDGAHVQYILPRVLTSAGLYFF